MISEQRRQEKLKRKGARRKSLRRYKFKMMEIHGPQMGQYYYEQRRELCRN